MWTAYHVVFRLRSPMHIGAGKVGNLQRTRPYIAGRNLWGALTERLTRDGDTQDYGRVGDHVHDGLAFTYFYPTTARDGAIDLWPWADPARFRYRFLSAETATALDPTTGTAQEASLHEVECIPPHTRQGEPVYLAGYFFQREDFGLDWQSALDRLQIGGERGYGWGRVEVAALTQCKKGPITLFDAGHKATLSEESVQIDLSTGEPVLAHALAASFADHPPLPKGSVEPLVGRETTPQGRFGYDLSAAQICYAPGAQVKAKASVKIGRYGVWVRLT